MRKNFIIVLMTIAIVFSVGVICHAETFEPTIDAMNGKVGETIDVTVSIPGGTTAVGGSFNLVYDNTKMELIDATAGELVKDRTNNVNKAYAANKIRMNFAGTTNISENGGVALKASFKLLEEGTSNISTENFKLIDIDTNALVCEDGSITISIAAAEPTVIPVTGISLSKTNLQLEVGKSEKITAIFSPDNATNRNVLWLSTASNIATVENGNITAVSEGNAQIIAITEDGSKSAVCTVTVIKSSKKEPTISVGGISFDITLDADEYSGNIIAALYSKEGKLNDLKTYPATRDLKISFDKGKTGAYIKIMWWKNLSSMVPVCEAQTITLQ